MYWKCLITQWKTALSSCQLSTDRLNIDITIILKNRLKSCSIWPPLALTTACSRGLHWSTARSISPWLSSAQHRQIFSFMSFKLVMMLSRQTICCSAPHKAQSTRFRSGLFPILFLPVKVLSLLCRHSWTALFMFTSPHCSRHCWRHCVFP